MEYRDLYDEFRNLTGDKIKKENKCQKENIILLYVFVIEPDELMLVKTIKTEDDFLDLYYFKRNINLEDLIINQNEVGEVRWFSIKEVEDLIKTKKFLDSHISIFKEFY